MVLWISDAAGDINEVGSLALAIGQVGEVASLCPKAGDEKGDVGNALEYFRTGVGEAEDEANGGGAVLRGRSGGKVGDALIEWFVVEGEALEVSAALI